MAPKNADAFMIVMPYNRKRGWYDASNVKYEFTEGKINKEEIDDFLQLLREEVPRSLTKINYEMLDGGAILILLIGIIILGLGIYFAIGHPFEGLRAAAILIGSIAIFGSLVYITIACIFRSKLSKARVSKLEEIIAKAQEEIFNEKGALVSLSPLESYITIEMVWKYIRIAMYSGPEEAEVEPKIPSLKEFNKDTYLKILEESKDKKLIECIQKYAIFNPAGLHAIEDSSNSHSQKNEKPQVLEDGLDEEMDEKPNIEAQAGKMDNKVIDNQKKPSTSSKLAYHDIQTGQPVKGRDYESPDEFVQPDILFTLPSSPEAPSEARPFKIEHKPYDNKKKTPSVSAKNKLALNPLQSNPLENEKEAKQSPEVYQATNILIALPDDLDQDSSSKQHRRNYSKVKADTDD